MSLALITKSYPSDCGDWIGLVVKALWSCLHFECSELFLQIWKILQSYQWSRSDGFKGPLHVFMYEWINNEMYMHCCFLAPRACVWILKEGVSLTSYTLLNAINNVWKVAPKLFCSFEWHECRIIWCSGGIFPPSRCPSWKWSSYPMFNSTRDPYSNYAVSVPDSLKPGLQEVLPECKL